LKQIKIFSDVLTRNRTILEDNAREGQDFLSSK